MSFQFVLIWLEENLLYFSNSSEEQKTFTHYTNINRDKLCILKSQVSRIKLSEKSKSIVLTKSRANETVKRA